MSKKGEQTLNDNDLIDTTDMEYPEDQVFGNFEDAMAALEDDDGTEGQTETDEEEVEDEETPEADEADDDEASEDETETEDDPEDDPESDVKVMINGEEISLDEAEKGYLRGADYTRKTERLAEERKATEAERETYTVSRSNLEQVFQNLTAFMQNLVPDEPSAEMLYSDPTGHAYQSQLRNGVIEQLKQVFALKEQADQIDEKANTDQLTRLQETEEVKLLALMPGLKDLGKKAHFEKAVAETAKSFGFTDDEITGTHDHRIKMLVHYARIGKIAEKNRQNANRRKSAKPQKQRRTRVAADGRGKVRTRQNREAMKRLGKSGSFQDAMAVDFD